MHSVNYIFTLSLSVIALGYILKSTGYLSAEHGKSASRIIFNVTLPALIIKTISTIDLNKEMIMMPMFCFFFAFVPLAVSYFVFRKHPKKERGTSMITAAGFNVGLFSFPLIEGLFGDKGLKLMAMFDFGNAFVIFGLVYLLGYSFSVKAESKKLTPGISIKLLFTSIPFMGYILGIVINVSGAVLPGPVIDFLGVLSRANMALALLTLGLTLNFSFDRKHWNLILTIVGIRYLTGIAAGILIYFLLPFPRLTRIILLFGLTLPVGLSSIPFAVEFGYDPEVTGTINNMTIVLSFAIMWISMLILF